MNDNSLDVFLGEHFLADGIDNNSPHLEKLVHSLRQWLTADHELAYPVTPFQMLAASFDDYSIPATGMDVDKFLDELKATVLDNTAQLNHPKFVGHMTQALPWMTVFIEAVTAVLNQNQVKVETAYASTLVEKQVLGWFHRVVFGNDDTYYADAIQATDFAVGNFVNGGTMGNLTALAVAVEQQLPGSRRIGLHAALSASGYRGVAIVGSVRCHYSLKKAVATLGLGEDALHLVAVDRDNRIDLDALANKLAQLKADNIKLLALIGIAGTTETGAIDPLAQLASMARSENAWFHVDAAWGGALMMADRYRSLYEGAELADSIVIDGHKLLWVPMAQGMVLFRNRRSLDHLKHHANYIIRANSADLGQTSLEGSRRFDALKLWAGLKLLGAAGYTRLLRVAEELTEETRLLLLDQPDFELTTASGTFILTYRFVPGPLHTRMEALLEEGRLDEATELNAKLNLLNSRLQERQKSIGRSFVSRTVLESTRYPGETTVLRLVLTNVRTTPRHLREILAHQREIGHAIMAENPAFWSC